MASVTNLLYLASVSEDIAEHHQLIALAQQELQRVSEIVNQTLRFHRQPTRAQEACMPTMILGLLTMLQSRVNKARVVVERRDRARHPVVCFEGEVRQVLANLISNAIDASAPGGRLLVRTREGYQWNSGRWGLHVTIADNGHGMSKETLGQIFDAFFTTKGVGGTGLGLWITQEILSRHGGALRVRSSQRVGRSGTVFTIFLPQDDRAGLAKAA